MNLPLLHKKRISTSFVVTGNVPPHNLTRLSYVAPCVTMRRPRLPCSVSNRSYHSDTVVTFLCMLQRIVHDGNVTHVERRGPLNSRAVSLQTAKHDDLGKLSRCVRCCQTTRDL